MAYDNLAALVRALAILRPAGPLDSALVRALADLIDPRPAVAAPARRPPPPVPVSAPPSAADHLAAPAAVVPPMPSRAQPVVDPGQRRTGSDPRKLVALESALRQISKRADLVSPRQGFVLGERQDKRGAVDTPGPLPPIESLFLPGRVRAILREMATVATPSGLPDLAAAVALIARGEAIRALPQRLTSTLGHSIQWLFDVGPAMLPFARDKQQLAQTAERTLGRDRVRVGDFIVDPLKGVRPRGQVRWAPLRWPGRGSAIVVVSDLGIGSDLGMELGSQDAWREFLGEAAGRDVHVVLLNPYARERWPAVAFGFGTALAWDLGTGVQALRRTRPRHARVGS